ncbi:hypothetical protein OMO38_05265 [Chryseobacterium sp. 09-1422]|uniref:Uncharacterized protein n=1 Tax=Chryseobacterium kimseyorum TaxID=2984028 RepID=A0ABT3HVW6_9FLAO|nr:hypothetical protein [Chryseobacterium kimseyorum]MCW3167932.1 hypothetical protein [Chryseobacterium kimseyorum]
MDQKDLWAIELLSLYEKRNTVAIKKKLFENTDLLIYLHEILAEKNVQLQEKDVYSEQLIIKFHLQNLSVLKLSEGHPIESRFFNNKASHIKFLDISSIITIMRSQYESLLMYQHLYVNTQLEDEQKLRFQSWIMSSMMLRRTVFAESKTYNQEQTDNEVAEINMLRESIKNNENFKFLSEKQQKSLLETGSGKLFKTWDTLFKESKFAKGGVFSKIYYTASIYAHS